MRDQYLSSNSHYYTIPYVLSYTTRVWVISVLPEQLVCPRRCLSWSCMNSRVGREKLSHDHRLTPDSDTVTTDMGRMLHHPVRHGNRGEQSYDAFAG